jgi:hypothetical protein
MAQIFTKHFLARMAKRGIRLDDLQWVLLDPDNKVIQENGVTMYSKLIWDKVLRLWIAHEWDDDRLITFYYTSKIKKYLSAK